MNDVNKVYELMDILATEKIAILAKSPMQGTFNVYTKESWGETIISPRGLVKEITEEDFSTIVKDVVSQYFPDAPVNFYWMYKYFTASKEDMDWEIVQELVMWLGD